MKVRLPEGWKIEKKIYRIGSKSDPGKYHVVREYTDGTYECSCPGFWSAWKAGGCCSHVRLIIKRKNNGITANNDNEE